MMTQAFYPEEDDQEPKKVDPTDDPGTDDPAEKDAEETGSTPETDEEELLDDDGIEEGEEIE